MRKIVIFKIFWDFSTNLWNLLKYLKKFWILQFFSCENIRKYLHHPEGYIENISSPWQYISKYSNFVSNSKISYIINIGKLLEEYYKYTSLVARFARHSWCIFVIFLLQFTNIIVIYVQATIVEYQFFSIRLYSVGPCPTKKYNLGKSHC